MTEEMWGTEIKKGVLTSLQIVLIEKGVDWIPQLGGKGSPLAVNYSCRNPKCRAIPIRADRWMRFATTLMRALTYDQFREFIDRMNQPGMCLTEQNFVAADLVANPEWRCPICITKFEKESWGLQALICDTRDDVMSTDEIFIAPLGNMSQSVERAIGYLKTVTLLNEINNNGFNVQQMIEAIGRVNDRYAKRVITSQSVKV